MIRLEHRGLRLCDGVTRREFLRVGGLGPLGLSLPALLQSRAGAETAVPSFGRAKRCIQLFLWGVAVGLATGRTWAGALVVGLVDLGLGLLIVALKVFVLH